MDEPSWKCVKMVWKFFSPRYKQISRTLILLLSSCGDSFHRSKERLQELENLKDSRLHEWLRENNFQLIGWQEVTPDLLQGIYCVLLSIRIWEKIFCRCPCIRRCCWYQSESRNRDGFTSKFNERSPSESGSRSRRHAHAWKSTIYERFVNVLVTELRAH